MLTVTIEQGNVCKIGDAIVTVFEVRGDRVRLSIDAPDDCTIHRHSHVIEFLKECGWQRAHHTLKNMWFLPGFAENKAHSVREAIEVMRAIAKEKGNERIALDSRPVRRD